MTRRDPAVGRTFDDSQSCGTVVRIGAPLVLGGRATGWTQQHDTGVGPEVGHTPWLRAPGAVGVSVGLGHTGRHADGRRDTEERTAAEVVTSSSDAFKRLTFNP